jgi:hypothetical protein
MRYVRVSLDLTDKVIKEGPILWNGDIPLIAPIDQQFYPEDFAIAQGYTYSPLSPDVANAFTLRQRALTAITANNSFLALTPPLTNAQVVAQVNSLTRQNTALIKLLLNQTKDVSGT